MDTLTFSTVSLFNSCIVEEPFFITDYGKTPIVYASRFKIYNRFVDSDRHLGC